MLECSDAKAILVFIHVTESKSQLNIISTICCIIYPTFSRIKTA